MHKRTEDHVWWSGRSHFWAEDRYGEEPGTTRGLYGSYDEIGVPHEHPTQIVDAQESDYGRLWPPGSGWGIDDLYGDHELSMAGAGNLGCYGDSIDYVHTHGDGCGWGEDLEDDLNKHMGGEERYNRSCGAQHAGVPACEIDLEELADFRLTRYKEYYCQWDHYVPTAKAKDCVRYIAPPPYRGRP